MRLRSLHTAALISTALLMGGCAGASVDHRVRAGALPEPDMIVVNDFAVTPSDVRLDRGMMAGMMRDAKDRMPNEEERKVGYMVSQKLSESLVEELRKAGIKAVRSSEVVKTSPTTIQLYGEFLTVDQGNQSGRVWVGFGMGGSEVRTHINAVQDGKVVAEADTSTTSNLKPGMLASLGVGAAAESGAAVAVGAGATGVNEAFTGTVEADAKRTAKEVAKKIKEAYQDRGWLAK